METKQNELIEAFWNNWSHSLSLLSSAGKQVEQLAVESLKQQQELFEKLNENVDTVEKEWKQHISQLQTQYSEYVKGFAGATYADQVEQWKEKWNELSNQVQSFTLSPTKSSLSLLSQASAQLEEFLSQWISQQQQQREEAQEQFEEFLKEIQTLQLDLVKKFEETSSRLFPAV